MIGEVKGDFIVGEVRSKASLTGYLYSNTILADVEAGRITIEHSDIPAYEGAYEAVPTVNDQIFSTNEYKMTDDFTVRAIPYDLVQNESGGLTAIIAGGE